MFINGKEVRELREVVGMTAHDLADYLAMDVAELELYEAGEVWLEEDMFRLWTLSVILPENTYLLDGEYARTLEDIDQFYNLSKDDEHESS